MLDGLEYLYLLDYSADLMFSSHILQSEDVYRQDLKVWIEQQELFLPCWRVYLLNSDCSVSIVEFTMCCICQIFSLGDHGNEGCLLKVLVTCFPSYLSFPWHSSQWTDYFAQKKKREHCHLPRMFFAGQLVHQQGAHLQCSALISDSHVPQANYVTISRCYYGPVNVEMAMASWEERKHNG